MVPRVLVLPYILQPTATRPNCGLFVALGVLLAASAAPIIATSGYGYRQGAAFCRCARSLCAASECALCAPANSSRSAISTCKHTHQLPELLPPAQSINSRLPHCTPMLSRCKHWPLYGLAIVTPLSTSSVCICKQAHLLACCKSGLQ